MMTSWITLYPRWYMRERTLLSYHYPDLIVDDEQLRNGDLVLYGELTVRPPGGAQRYPVRVAYTQGTPFEHPRVTLLDAVPERNKDGSIKSAPEPRQIDQRHQMPDGGLCLFQRETRSSASASPLTGIDILRRAEKYLIGFHTGHWPPDTAEAELEAHYGQVGDVLVPSSFCRKDITGYGRLFLVLDLRRLPEVASGHVCPFLVTALTEESSGIVKPLDAREELVLTYPWIGDSAWDATLLGASTQDAMREDCRFQHGYWWSLPDEPMPFHDGAGLIKTLSSTSQGVDGWALLTDSLRTDLSVAESHFVGLKYPARDGGSEWLMLIVRRGKRAEGGGGILLGTDDEKRAAFSSAPVSVARVNRLEQSALHLRNTGVVSPDIREKTVALVGLGALGSSVAELLAKAGVGHFRLCDYDRLQTGNVARHVGGISDFGALKTDVVMKRLLQISPYIRFNRDDDILSASAVTSLDRLTRFMSSADITICTTADESVESVINQVAVINRFPVLYGRSMRRASMGRVFLVRSGTDACKACLGRHLQDGREGKPVPEAWIDIPEHDDDVLLHECGRPVIAGSAIDLSFIAGVVARVALDFLEKRGDLSNHWVWSQRPAPDVDCRLAAPLSTYDGVLRPRTDCPACREPEVTDLILAEDARNTIVTETEASPQSETGGVLIGYVDANGEAVALRATTAGPKAIRSRTEFRRDVAHCQEVLDQAARELGERGSYIGEWHSHLARQAAPSPIDMESLFGISGAPNYLTRCPVLLIVGLDPATEKVACLQSWSFPVGGRRYDIPNRVKQP